MFPLYLTIYEQSVIGADPLVGLVVIKQLEDRPIGRLPLV